MNEQSQIQLTERQKNEIEYHREHAKENEAVLKRPFSWDVLDRPSRRWWNAYWQMYAHLISLKLTRKRVLVVGCGFGDDALRLAKLGAEVYAFDLSPDSLRIARALADREGLSIAFDEMPAEKMTYPDDFFDCIVARDILHHVDIPTTMREIHRVAKPGAILVANEIYSHSITNVIRHSVLVEKFLYRRMRRLIYGAEKPYITEDERKLDEKDMETITSCLSAPGLQKHFNFLVTRIIPDANASLAKGDRILLALLKPIARFLAGRILISGRVSK